MIRQSDNCGFVPVVPKGAVLMVALVTTIPSGPPRGSISQDVTAVVSNATIDCRLGLQSIANRATETVDLCQTSLIDDHPGRIL